MNLFGWFSKPPIRKFVEALVLDKTPGKALAMLKSGKLSDENLAYAFPATSKWKKIPPEALEYMLENKPHIMKGRLRLLLEYLPPDSPHLLQYLRTAESLDEKEVGALVKRPAVALPLLAGEPCAARQAMLSQHGLLNAIWSGCDDVAHALLDHGVVPETADHMENTLKRFFFIDHPWKKEEEGRLPIMVEKGNKLADRLLVLKAPVNAATALQALIAVERPNEAVELKVLLFWKIFRATDPETLTLDFLRTALNSGNQSVGAVALEKAREWQPALFASPPLSLLQELLPDKKQMSA